MTDLIACLSIGKGTWNQIFGLINSGEFENIYLITNKNVKDKFKTDKPVKLIVIDPNNSITNIINEIYNSLKPRIKWLEVAINLTSGTGKEHMAILSALIKMGVGFRQVVWENNYLKEI
jgi:hypothetical protein